MDEQKWEERVSNLEGFTENVFIPNKFIGAIKNIVTGMIAYTIIWIAGLIYGMEFLSEPLFVGLWGLVVFGGLALIIILALIQRGEKRRLFNYYKAHGKVIQLYKTEWQIKNLILRRHGSRWGYGNMFLFSLESNQDLNAIAQQLNVDYQLADSGKRASITNNLFFRQAYKYPVEVNTFFDFIPKGIYALRITGNNENFAVIIPNANKLRAYFFNNNGID